LLAGLSRPELSVCAGTQRGSSQLTITLPPPSSRLVMHAPYTGFASSRVNQITYRSKKAPKNLQPQTARMIHRSKDEDARGCFRAGPRRLYFQRSYLFACFILTPPGASSEPPRRLAPSNRWRLQKVFELEEFLDAVFRPPVIRQVGADAAFLRASGGRDLVRGPLGEVMPSLMPTMPYSSASATRQM
jgi:hypothetical protein